MDFHTGARNIATPNHEFNRVDSNEFTARLVPVHTGPEESEPNPNVVKTADFGADFPFEHTKLLMSTEYNDLKSSDTSFNNWASQTALLRDLLEQGTDFLHTDHPFLKKDTFGPEGDFPSDDDEQYELFFKRNTDGSQGNKEVVTFLVNSFPSLEDGKPLVLKEGMSVEFEEFRGKFTNLVENCPNELKLKKALLTVAFNHYGCHTVAKSMTLSEFMDMLRVVKLFETDDAARFVFDSMDRKHRSMVTETEFVAGMLCCSPDATQKLAFPFGKLRLQHVFRAYDPGRLGYLAKTSMVMMQKHLEENLGGSEDTDSGLAEKLLNMFNGKLSYDSFFYCVENNLLKNTTLLLRSTRDLADSVRKLLLHSLRNVNPEHKQVGATLTQLVPESERPTTKTNSPTTNSMVEKVVETETTSQPISYTPSFSNQNQNRSSLWSHTPRVYSEFTHDRPQNRDSLFNFGQDSSWSKTPFNQQHRTESQFERLSKMYDRATEEATERSLAPSEHKEVTLTHEPEPVLDQRPVSPQLHNTVVASPEPELPAVDPQLTPVLQVDGVEHLNPASDQNDHEVFMDAKSSGSDSNHNPQEHEDKMNRIKEFLREYEADTRTPENSVGASYSHDMKHPDSFKDVYEDETQLLGHSKDHESFKSPEVPTDLTNGLLKITEYSTAKPVPPASPLETAHKEDLPVPSDSLSPDSELGFGNEKPEGDTLLEALTNQLLSRYKAKFLVTKGLLVDDSVAKMVFKNFLVHSLGHSTGHESLKLCSYTDMLQLCDSVCSLLKKEDSLLDLKGDFQVFASLNGDLSCLLDLFNTYGWPMLRKRSLEEDNLANLNLKNANWTDFDFSYLFMGGFVSGLNSVSLEFVLLLFSLKVLFPYHVYFLRSGKDERNSSNEAGLYDELYTKLAENHAALKLHNDETFILQCSKELFHRINDVFEFMSLAAVLNGDVLCVDRLTTGFSLENLADLPKPLNLTTCANQQVYELIFSESNPFQACNTVADGANSPLNLVSEAHVSSGEDDKFPEEGGLVQVNGAEAESGCKNEELPPELTDLDLEAGDYARFRMVICSSDDLDGGFKYLLNNKLLLLSTNLSRKVSQMVATALVITKKKITHRSLEL